MAINPNIALQGQPVNMQQAIMGGLETGERIRNMGIRDALLRQQQQAGQQQLQQGRTQAAMQQGALANQVFSQLSQVPLSERAGVLARMGPRLSQMGIDPRQIDISDDGIQRGLQATQMFAPQGGEAFTLKAGETRFDPQGRPIASGGEVPDESEQEIISETRKELRGTVKSLRERAGGAKQTYEKLYNLADEMREGNRSAVSQGLIALVKLGDPTSVVRESEMISALNRQNPVSAVFDLLKQSGTTDQVAAAVSQRIDPLNPDNVDVDDILSTADAIMAPAANEITQAYQIARSRADDARLSEKGIQAIFGDQTSDLFDELAQIRERIEIKNQQRRPAAGQAQPRGGESQGAAQQPRTQQPQPSGEVIMEHPRFGAVTEADIQQTMQETGMTRPQVFQRLMEQAQ